MWLTWRKLSALTYDNPKDEKDIEAFKTLNERGIELEVSKVSSDSPLKMGVLVNQWTHVNIPFVVSRITNTKGQTTVQTILDQLTGECRPGFFCFFLGGGGAA